MKGAEAVVLANAESRNELLRYSDRAGVRPVLRHQDLPKDFELLARPELWEMYRRFGLLVSTKGEIFCSNPFDSTSIERIKNLLTASKTFRRDQLRIIPTDLDVIENIIDVAVNDKHPVDLQNQSEDDKSRAQRDVDSLINDALRLGSSDIHIDAKGNRASVYMRIDGALAHVHSAWSAEHVKTMCSAIVDGIAGGSDGGAHTHFKVNEPVDATPILNVNGERLKLRYAHTPRAGGIKAVIRILKHLQTGKLTLSELGYLDEQRFLIEQIKAAPQGLVMVGGPTGSGKTTTLALIMDMFDEEKAMYSYEDPVEIENDRICQVMIEPESSTCNWVAHSKNVLRLDPDIIQYGELREKAVADHIVNAASTGHLVLSTVHTNSAPLIVQRLNDLGINYRRLGDPEFLKLLIFQRLLPRTCRACSVPLSSYQTDDHVIRREVARLKEHFISDSDLEEIHVASQDTDCKKCGGTGRSGRVLVAEVVKIDDKGRELIREGRVGEWITYLKRQGWRSVVDHADINVRRGLLCPLKAEQLLGRQFDNSVHHESFDYNAFRKSIREISRSDPYDGAQHEKEYSKEGAE